MCNDKNEKDIVLNRWEIDSLIQGKRLGIDINDEYVIFLSLEKLDDSGKGVKNDNFI